jgi:hypothetical protein
LVLVFVCGANGENWDYVLGGGGEGRGVDWVGERKREEGIRGCLSVFGLYLYIFFFFKSFSLGKGRLPRDRDVEGEYLCNVGAQVGQFFILFLFFFGFGRGWVNEGWDCIGFTLMSWSFEAGVEVECLQEVEYSGCMRW